MTTKMVNEIKKEWVENIKKAVAELALSTEKPQNVAVGRLVYPTEAGIPVQIDVIVPKGERFRGTFRPYDGYLMAEDWEYEAEYRTAPVKPQLKDEWLAKLGPMLGSDDYFCTDVLTVGCSELSFPVLDPDRNEIYVNVKITNPKGKRA